MERWSSGGVSEGSHELSSFLLSDRIDSSSIVISSSDDTAVVRYTLAG